MRTRLRRRNRLRFATGLLFAASLSFLAGLTDVVGFILAGDFVSFMSGNTTRLAIALSSGDGAGVLRLALVVATFVVGNAFGVLLMRWTRGSQPALLCLVGILALVPLLFAEPAHGVTALVFAMGALNAALEEVDGQALGVTYVTGALSRFGRGLGRFLIGHHARGWWVQIVPWTGMAAGALTGALLAHRWGGEAVFAVAGLALVLALVGLVVPPGWRRVWLARKPFRRQESVPRRTTLG
jgi:uncharacterized membrane protein YoaK (UPF0700 family)